MPWCDACSRFLTPNALRPDGSCPSCGRPVADPDADLPERDGPAPDPDGAAGPDEEHTRVPWHFWLLLLAAALYLGWRAIEGVVWLVGQF